MGNTTAVSIAVSTGGVKKQMDTAVRKHLRRSITFSAIYIAIMAYAVFLGFTQPYNNWDMLGYVGCVVEWRASDPASVYPDTMEAIRQKTSPALFHTFLDNPLSAGADAFEQQLPIYRVKPLYVALVWLVGHVASVPASTWIVSATCFFLLSTLLFAWSPRYMAREAWLTLVGALALLWPWPLAHLARLSTPDCLETLLQISAIYVWTIRRSFWGFALFCWLACLARPDALILSGVLAICFAIPAGDKAMPILRAGALIGFLVVTCFAITHFGRCYSYEKLFIYNYVDRTPYPAEIREHLTLERYWTILQPALALFLKAPRQIAMLFLSVVACFCYYLRSAENKRMLLLLLGTWTALTIRFIFFPAWGDDRYYFVYWIPILFASGELISAYTPVLWKLIQAHRVQIRAL